MVQDLFRLLGSVYPMPPALQSHIISILKQETIPKDAFILKAGQVNDRMVYIDRGLLWAYYLKDDKQISSWIMAEQEFVVSITSFYKQVPSMEYIQALEETEIYYITFDEMRAISRNWLEFAYIASELKSDYLVRWDMRVHSLLCTTAEERLAWLEENQPALFQRVKYKYIASFCGMSEQHYSRVRSQKKITKTDPSMRKAS